MTTTAMRKRKPDSPPPTSPMKQRKGKRRSSASQPALPTAKCFFLDTLPPELRLNIYEYLVVSHKPLRGRTAARKDEQYGLDLTILRVNHQIHEEAHSLFFGKNTFYVTSIPDPASNSEASKAIGQFDPPLNPSHWPLIRHLQIDLLYYPTTLVSEPGRNGEGWRPVDPGAAAYITNLISLLVICSSKLQTLKFIAQVNKSFCAKKCLVSFFMCDRDRAFARALASVCVKSVPVHFEFPDCYYHMEVKPDIFVKKSILLLACQVMFCQSQVKINQLLDAFQDGKLKVLELGEKERTDLGPFVGQTWPGKGMGMGMAEVRVQ